MCRCNLRLPDYRPQIPQIQGHPVRLHFHFRHHFHFLFLLRFQCHHFRSCRGILRRRRSTGSFFPGCGTNLEFYRHRHPKFWRLKLAGGGPAEKPPSSAKKRISLTRIPAFFLSAKWSASRSESGTALGPDSVKHLTKLTNSSRPTRGRNPMLATPELVRKSAKLRSAWLESRGTPSSNNCEPEAPRSRPPWLVAATASCNSFQAASSCPTHLECRKP